MELKYLGLSYFLILLFRFLIVVWRSKVVFDSFGHLYYTKLIKEQKCGPFGAITTNVVEAKLWRHPFLYHWVLTIFSTEHLYKINKYINPVLDSLYSVSILLVAQMLTNNWYIGFLSGVLYLTCPMWFTGFSIGPRIKSFSPRIVSEIGVNFFLIIFLLPIPISLKLLLSIAIGTFVLLSSKFGLQALLFISVITSIIDFNYYIILILSLSVLTSIIVTKGQFVKTFHDQILHLKWYFINNLKNKTAATSRNSLKRILKKSENDKMVIHVSKVLIRMLSLNSFTGVLLKLPILFFFLYIFISFDSYTNIEAEYISYVSSTVLAGLFLFFVINIRVLLFLGEAERYLNHVSFFIVFYIAYFTMKLDLLNLTTLFILYGICFLIFEYFLFDKLNNKIFKKNIELADEKVITFLKDLENQVILCYPYNSVGFWRIMYQTNHKVLYPITCKEEFIKRYEKLYSDGYPFASLSNINMMYEDFGLNMVIVDKKYNHDAIINNTNWTLIRSFDNIYSIYYRKK